ncbi:MAG TPA: ATP phosphoribosyltransferase regulatory subunit [Lachnospiraceae bacterium]|jgi:ATP phosphoribosyltransferase regulatory subunit|nr:ATP phosphoribosyltransferase regulatory subunit [Lachnospiraceae bacterium]
MKKRLLHTPEGVRDIYGIEYEKKLKLQDTLHQQLKLYGYCDIQTPTFEYFDIFSNKIGTIPSKELYKFFDKEGSTLVLRPDFTPSIARATAKYFMEETMPLRFCYVGNTFINTNELQGRLKETTQIGAELIGDASVEADAEMISLVIASMQKAGLKDFQISIGNVEFFKGLCAEYNIDEEIELSLREFISNKNYFGTQDILDSLHIKEASKNVILKVSEMFGTIDAMRETKALVSNQRSVSAIERLEQLYDLLCIYGIEKYVSFDLGMLSKYNYYTGIIFRAYTYGSGDAVMKGGRYDNLLSEFGKTSAAIGFVTVVDQLLSALSRQNIEIQTDTSMQLVIFYQEAAKTAITFAEELRAKGVHTQLTLIQTKNQEEDYLNYAKQNRIDTVYCIQKDASVKQVKL